MPQPTDLVTDLPADFEVFGQAVDSSLADLKGGSTGQVLSKNSNTDMDFVWVTSDDANAIQNSIVNAKGDIIGASANDTPAITSVGSDGSKLFANSGTASGLSWQGSMEAGKNILINGGFDIWQRGTSISVSAFNYGYTADRWLTFNGQACTVSQETSTVPAGSRYALKVTGGATTGGYEMWQIIETANAIALAGQPATLSVYATGTTGSLCSVTLDYSTGTDTGSTGSWTAISPSSATTSLTAGTFSKISTQVTVPSNAKSLRVRISSNALTSGQYQIYGNAQLELGYLVTNFSRAGGTIQGELAACQRYYWRNTADNAYDGVVNGGIGFSTTQAFFTVQNPVTMRTQPTSIDYSTTYSLYRLTEFVNEIQPTAIGLDGTTDQYYSVISFTTAGSLTQFRPYIVRASSTTGGAYIGISAEL